MDRRYGLVVGAALLLGSATVAATPTTLIAGPMTNATGFARLGNTFSRVGTLAERSAGARIWAAAMGAAGEVAVSDAVMLSGPAGNLAISAAARIGVADAAAAMLSASMLPEALVVGSAAYLALQAYKMYSEDSGLMSDPGVPSVQASCTGRDAPIDGGGTCLSATQWCNMRSGVIGAPSGSRHSVKGTEPNVACVTEFQPSGPNGDWIQYAYDPMPSVYTRTDGKKCPMSIDAFNPANNIPEGAAPYSDGTCKTARGHHDPMTPQQGIDRMVQNPSAMDPTAEVGALKRAIEKGETIPVTPTGTSGPAGQPGSPVTTTTTGPAGTSTTVTTETWNYNYSPTTITIYEGSTSVTTNPDGTVTGTSTTGVKPPPAADQVDPCTANPTRVGCMDAGTPSDVNLNKRDIQVGATPDSGWGASDAACPAPRTVMVLGQAVKVDNSLVCKFMSGIRFAVVGVAGLAAALLFLSGLKS